MARPSLSRAADPDTVLRTVADWLTHWQADAARNLGPTPESLADLATLVDAALARSEAVPKEFVAELASDIGIPISQVIQSVRGGLPENQGDPAMFRAAAE